MEAGSHYTLEAIMAKLCGQAPSATELSLLGGLKFQAKTDNLTIDFDEDNKTVTIPQFKWNPHTEVVVRNLVVYEAATTTTTSPPSPPNDDLPLTQYIHFMHMIISTARDVELLMDAGVIVDSPRDESRRIRDTFRALCTCRIDRGKVVKEGKLVDDELRRRLNRCNNHAYAEVRSYYTRRRVQIVVQKYAALLYLAFFFGVGYLLVTVGSLSLVCGLMKKLLASSGGGGECGSCVANIATCVNGGTKRVDGAV